jgi:hypothetical protein
MKEATRYRYEKRIKELEERNLILREYKEVAQRIFRVVTDQIQEGKGISCAWICKQFVDVMK